MRTHAPVLVGAAVLSLTVWFLAGPGNAQNGKENPFKPILPKGEYQELVKRAIKETQEQLNSKEDDAPKKAAAAALLLVAYTMSTAGDKENLEALRKTALDIIDAIKNEKLNDAKALAATLPTPKAGKGIADPGPLNKHVEDLGDIMTFFKQKAKGGEGLHPSLFLNQKLKNLNGVEELIRELARVKKLDPKTLAKAKDELIPVAYRTAVIGSITYQYAPNAKQGMKDPEDWRRWSLDMRDRALDLAAAVSKDDIKEVKEAATRLNTTCTQCHGIFRPN
jgi:hypothetical protein